MNGFEVNEVEMECGTGTLTAAGTARQEVSLSCGTGEINYTASDQKESYDYRVSVKRNRTAWRRTIPELDLNRRF